ncbi:MAG: bis(5'-nucleosyl)-tetraphosphatase (symmetrical) YqeK [Lachnospiraceae bacterium]|nr:bis(5'-nucleosyl)-tetraphosphatase (symmetrical) YqeK [Lachnospiraceae bacterium]
MSKEESEKKISCKALRKQMEKVQDEKRYEHTLGVAFTAASLAMRYGADVRKAQIAGLLHDCAKCMTNEERINLCKKNKIEITEIEHANPFLLHAKVGAFLAKEKYDITDNEILSAISYHTTGRPEMTLLEKIVYIADYIEPGRKTAPNLDEVRRLAFENLEEALYKILSDTLEYLQTSDQKTDPMTRQTYEYYRNIRENKNGFQRNDKTCNAGTD